MRKYLDHQGLPFLFCHRVLNRCPFDFLASLRSLDSACHPLRKIGEFFFVFPPQIPLEKHVLREWKVYRNLPLASYLIFTERDVFLYIKSRFGLAFVSHHPSHISGFLREDFFFYLSQESKKSNQKTTPRFHTITDSLRSTLGKLDGELPASRRPWSNLDTGGRVWSGRGLTFLCRSLIGAINQRNSQVAWNTRRDWWNFCLIDIRWERYRNYVMYQFFPRRSILFQFSSKCYAAFHN